MSDLERWQNRSPGDLSRHLPIIERTPIAPAIAQAVESREWARTPLADRIAQLAISRRAIESNASSLALGIALETGKPLKEARAEIAAVLAKFEHSAADAQHYLKQEEVPDGPHPAWTRRRPRGPAAVIAPFNFPIHLGHGAALAHLLAGNPVLFKPSPQAAVVAGQYGELMRSSLPPGVFTLIQGGAASGCQLCLDPAVRSICFTGSADVGRQLARSLAGDLGKEVALELGGKNSAIVCHDADLSLAASAIAEGACLTTGQRCNSTSRVLVDRRIVGKFVEALLDAIAPYVPGDPLSETTRLGPLISAASTHRYGELIDLKAGDWLLRGKVIPLLGGKQGYYVAPAIVRLSSTPSPATNRLLLEESFSPLLSLQEFSTTTEAIQLSNRGVYGLTCSIFTKSEAEFWKLSEQVFAGNVYANLPTTFSPSTLPFGGWGDSGNRRPGGRGFIRFATDEQAVQIAKGGFETTN